MGRDVIDRSSCHWPRLRRRGRGSFKIPVGRGSGFRALGRPRILKWEAGNRLEMAFQSPVDDPMVRWVDLTASEFRIDFDLMGHSDRSSPPGLNPIPAAD